MVSFNPIVSNQKYGVLYLVLYILAAWQKYSKVKDVKYNEIKKKMLFLINSNEGVTQPAPAPRFSRTQGKIQSSASLIGENSEEILGKWGFTNDQINNMRDNNTIW